MGVDVNLYAVVEATDEQIEAARDLLVARSGIADEYESDGKVRWRAVERWEHVTDQDVTEPRVRANVTSRYYGPGYERGDWPAIYGAIRLMQAAFPSATVYYGGDSWDDAPECSEEHLAEIWAHFLGPEGDNYRAVNRRRNAALSA